MDLAEATVRSRGLNQCHFEFRYLICLGLSPHLDSASFLRPRQLVRRQPKWCPLLLPILPLGRWNLQEAHLDQ